MRTYLIDQKADDLYSQQQNKRSLNLKAKTTPMKQLLSYRPLNSNIAALLLRLMFGSLFVRYGYMKFSSYDTILPMFQDIIGIGAKLSFDLVIFAELVCGFFVLVGLLTRFTVIPIFITMAVAFFVAHRNDPFDNKTIALVYLCLSVVIFFLGSGKFSLDWFLFKNKTKTNSTAPNGTNQ